MPAAKSFPGPGEPPQRYALAVALILAATTLFALMDSVGKYLGASLSLLQVVWGRYAVHTALTGAVLARRGNFGFLRPARPGLQLARGGCLFIGTLSMYEAIRHISLADATAVQYLNPVIVTILSALVLKETVGPRRWFAVAAAFVGALLIIQPGRSDFTWPVLLPLVTAAAQAGYMTLTRFARQYDYERVSIFYSTAPGAAALTLLLPLFWTGAQPLEFALLAAAGGFSALGHGLLVLAFGRASASALSPFLYWQIAAAALVSVTFFGDPLRPLMVLGTAILAGSGLYIWWRERRLKPAA